MSLRFWRIYKQESRYNHCMSRLSIAAAIAAFLFVLLSCRPMIAIGWEELTFALALLLIFFGGPLFRFFRRYGEFRKFEEQKKQKKHDPTPRPD